jgi:hypothetical protein
MHGIDLRPSFEARKGAHLGMTLEIGAAHGSSGMTFIGKQPTPPAGQQSGR